MTEKSKFIGLENKRIILDTIIKDFVKYVEMTTKECTQNEKVYLKQYIKPIKELKTLAKQCSIFIQSIPKNIEQENIPVIEEQLNHWIISIMKTTYLCQDILSKIKAEKIAITNSQAQAEAEAENSALMEHHSVIEESKKPYLIPTAIVFGLSVLTLYLSGFGLLSIAALSITVGALQYTSSSYNAEKLSKKLKTKIEIEIEIKNIEKNHNYIEGRNCFKNNLWAYPAYLARSTRNIFATYDQAYYLNKINDDCDYYMGVYMQFKENISKKHSPQNHKKTTSTMA